MYVRDFDFSDQLVGSKVLSILLLDDSLFYSILDENHTMHTHQTYQGIRFSSNDDLSAILADTCLGLSFSKITVCVMNHKYFHLPQVMSNLDHVVDGLAYSEVYVEKIAANEAITHFGITTHQKKWLDTLCRQVPYNVHHFSNVMGLYYIQHPGNVIHAHIEQNELHIFVQKDGKFCGYRNFETIGVEDIMYYLLAFYDEYKLSPSYDMLILSGWIEADSILFTQIYGFIAKVHWVDDTAYRLISETTRETKDHFYFAHFANSLCVS
jgi:Protein of unknown function (DUF3822)